MYELVLNFYLLCVCAHMCPCVYIHECANCSASVEVRGQLCGVSSLSLFVGSGEPIWTVKPKARIFTCGAIPSPQMFCLRNKSLVQKRISFHLGLEESPQGK